MVVPVEQQDVVPVERDVVSLEQQDAVPVEQELVPVERDVVPVDELQGAVYLSTISGKYKPCNVS